MTNVKLLFFIVTMTLSSINFSINSPLLHNGLLDLETQDFSKSEILLHGDWKYEGTVDEKEQFVHFPEKGNPTLGKSGTYTLRITSAKPGEFLALRTENTSGTCTLSINGKEINYIRTSLQGTDNPITNIKIYHFHVPSEDFKLTLKVSDFYVNCSDPCGGIFLYSPKRYSRMVRLKEMEDFIFQGFLFSLILIYTAMYLMGKKQKEFLFFALMNCGLSLWLLSDSQSFLDLYSLSGREDFFFRLSLIGLEIALIFSLLFIGWYKGKPHYRRLLRNATILFTTAIPLIIFLPIGVLSQYLDIARGEVLLCLSLIMTEGIQKMKKRIIIPQSLLPGFIMLTVSFIVRSFFVTPPLFSDFLLRFSLIVFVMQQFLYHTYLSLNSFNRIKELNKDYAQLNLELKDSLSRIEDQSVLIQYISSRDEITGLPNRNQFSTIFEREISNPCDKSKYLCFALVEWEDYKSFLHRKGIRVQKEVIHSFADQIRNFCTDRDWVCRYSDDRFLFMLHTEDNDKESRINKLYTTFTAPLKLKDEEYFPKINLGYTLYNGDSLTQETLLNQLFSARDYSKKQNLMAPCLYNQTIDVSLTKKALLEKKLKKALKSKILEMYYQPQHDSQNYALIGMEALLRWNDRDLGNMNPEIFIPLAEELGLIEEIDRYVIQAVLTQMKKWNNTDLEHVRVAINISPLNFVDPLFIDDFIKQVDEQEIDPDRLELELTESVLVYNRNQIRRNMITLKEKGFTIALDDFGTGYSSLAYLSEFPVDVLKIDKAFVMNLLTDDRKKGIINSIIAIGNALGMNIISEGVEKEEELNYLKKAGSHRIQGYVFSQALPADSLLKYYRKKTVPTDCSSLLSGSVG